MADPNNSILFLCTGNYYRSRYAELLFNAYAEERKLAWHADSRGLAVDRSVNNHGPIARCVAETMSLRGWPIPEPMRFPLLVTQEDLQRFGRVICLKEAEHRPLLIERHPGWEDRVEYWHIHDIDCATVEETLAGIEREIAGLIEQLS